MGNRCSVVTLAALAGLLPGLSINSTARADFRIIHTFGGANDGLLSFSNLSVSGSTLYGTTYMGGTNRTGTVFQIDANGSGFRILHSFLSGNDGDSPVSAPIRVGDVLYGMTSNWRGYSPKIYRLNADGTGYTVLHNLSYSDGPEESLTWYDGRLYGTLPFGGGGSGSFFSLGPDGSDFQEVDIFPRTTVCVEPRGPLLPLGGSFYGIANQGGATNNGSVFKINPDGSGLSAVYSTAKNGSHANNSLINVGTTLYGLLWSGGTGDGELFKVESDGSDYVTLHAFGGPGDGRGPQGSLVQYGDMLYGATFRGGAGNAGTIFRIGIDGSGYTIVYDFEYPVEHPENSLVLYQDTLYGMTSGHVFAFTVPEPSTLSLVLAGWLFLKRPNKGNLPSRRPDHPPVGGA